MMERLVRHSYILSVRPYESRKMKTVGDVVKFDMAKKHVTKCV